MFDIYLNRSEELKIKEKTRFAMHFCNKLFKNSPSPVRKNNIIRFRYLYLMEKEYGSLCQFTFK